LPIIFYLPLLMEGHRGGIEYGLFSTWAANSEGGDKRQKTYFHCTPGGNTKGRFIDSTTPLSPKKKDLRKGALWLRSHRVIPKLERKKEGGEQERFGSECLSAFSHNTGRRKRKKEERGNIDAGDYTASFYPLH